MPGVQDASEDYEAAEAAARKAVATMEAAFGEGNPRCSTAYGMLASILKCALLARLLLNVAVHLV